jgi:putative two-component system response regulator
MPGKILIVDDNDANARFLDRLLRRDGHSVRCVSSGAEALAVVAKACPDLILMDVMMPGIDGFETCRQLKSQAATRLIPIVLVTALQDSRDRIEGLEAGADDFISKPLNAQELTARVNSLLRIKRYTDDLDTAESVIMSLALVVEARDPYTDGHCQRLARYAAALGTELGLGEEDLSALERGGFLHDIGKVGIPDAILLKPGPLTSAEYTVMKSHAAMGDRLCGELRSLQRVRPIIRAHHERLDGTGYPDGLRGDAIPLLAQIIGVVDVFDALTTDRPYRAALSPEAACRELVREVERGWKRTDLVGSFIDMVQTGRLPELKASPIGLR